MPRKPKRPDLNHCKVSIVKNPRAPFRVWFPREVENGKTRRCFQSFADEEGAWEFAVKKDREVSNHGVRYGDISPEVRRAFDFYRDTAHDLTEAGASVPKFEELVSDALAKLRESFEAQTDRAVTVAEGVADFKDYKRSRVGERQLKNISEKLTRFAQTFGTRESRSITTAEIDQWLTSLRSRRNPAKLPKSPLLGSLSRNHYRAALSAFFSYAAAPSRKWVERNPIADLEPERVETGEPEAYTTKAVAKLMQAALDHKPELVPVLALGMFAGLRVSEALMTDLSKLPDKAGEFRTTGKTGARMAPYTETCAAWIATQPRRTDKAWTQSARAHVDHMQELYALAKVKPINNGARHSFISYRTAETRDVARVADECGNSVSTIKNHYRQLVTSEEAVKFFAIRPETKAENVTQIEKGRRTA